jgi:hypothetical protein
MNIVIAWNVRSKELGNTGHERYRWGLGQEGDQAYVCV